MSEVLYPYYERELSFIRQMVQEFAKQYPAAAGRLLLEPNQSRDPHVERLIEAFALIAGRIHHKLDDEFPELTDALLTILYPHYLAPIPSMAMLQFELDPERSQLPDGFLIEKGTQLHTQPVRGLPCRYRTGLPIRLWPVELTFAKFQPPPFPPGLAPPPGTAAVLRLQFACQGGMQFAGLSLEALRLHLFGNNELIAQLYETLFNHTTQVVYRPFNQPTSAGGVTLPPAQALAQVGFNLEEGLLPYPNQSLLGYRLLTEFFAFPAKFLFVDLLGWQHAAQPAFGNRLEVDLYLNRTLPSLEQGVDAQTFRVGCGPVVNLFEQTLEPVQLSQSKYEYRLVPDVSQPLGLEVYQIQSVSTVEPGNIKEYLPFYAYRHGQDRQTEKSFWYASRRRVTGEGDRGTDVYLHLVDLDFNPRVPAESAIVVRALCTNRDLPAILQKAGEGLFFELESAAPLTRINCLRSPTLPLRPPLRRAAYWRLLSHLALNHLSITDPVEGRAALQEILRLYDFSDPKSDQRMGAVAQQLIEGIVSVSSQRVVGRVGGPVASGFCRGVEVTVELDEEKYVGTGAFLFASVLERFLGLYASVNSFSQLVLKTRQQGKGYTKKWPPRAGEMQLL